MTVKLLSAWGVQPAGTLFTAGAVTEAAMIEAKVATADLTGGVAWVPPGSDPGVGTGSGGGANLTSAAVFLPPTDDYAGIMAARAAAIAAGGGTVQLKAITYDIGGNTIPLVNGVVFQGAGNVFNYSAAIAPDFGLTAGTGTIIKGNGTAAAFAYNATPRGAIWASQIALTLDGVSNTGVKNLCIDGALHGIMCGNLYASGAWWSVFQKVVAINCTGWGFYFENFQHVMFDNLYAINCVVGHHYYGASGSDKCNLGNSSFRDIFQTYGPLHTNTTKHCVFQARDPLGAGSSINNLNIANIAGVSANAASSTGGVTQAGCTFNGANANINIPNSAEFPVGMPLRFTAITGATNIVTTQTYFVRTSAANVITISVAKEIGAAIVPNVAGTCTINTLGFPVLSFEGIDNSGLTNIKAVNIDTEGSGSALIFLQRLAQEGNSIEVGGGINGALTKNISSVTVRLCYPLLLNFLSQCSQVDIDPQSDRIVIGVGYRPQRFAVHAGTGGRQAMGLGFAFDSDPLVVDTPSTGIFMDGSSTPTIRHLLVSGITTFAKWVRFRHEAQGNNNAINTNQGSVITGVNSLAAAWTQRLPDASALNVGIVIYINNPTAFDCTVTTVGGQTIHHNGVSAASNVLAARSTACFVSQFNNATYAWGRCN